MKPKAARVRSITMGGFITGKDVLLHGATIVREFGPRVYFRALFRMTCHARGRTVTFLECIHDPVRPKDRCHP